MTGAGHLALKSGRWALGTGEDRWTGRDVHPDVVATANPGCTLQIAAAARRRGTPLTIRHPIELLAAYTERTASLTSWRPDASRTDCRSSLIMTYRFYIKNRPPKTDLDPRADFQLADISL